MSGKCFIGVIFENKNQQRTDGKEKRTEKNSENRVHYHRLLIPLVEQLLQWAEMRFPYPSTSFDMKRRANKTGPSTPTLDQTSLSSQCSIATVPHLVEFPYNIIFNHLNPTSFPSGLDGEVQMMIQDININREKIVDAFKQRVRFETLKTGIAAV